MEAPYVETGGAGGELSFFFFHFIGICLMPEHRRDIITKVTVSNSAGTNHGGTSPAAVSVSIFDFIHV